MKSIRKDDVKTTATGLDVKIGDKFIVLSRYESYNNEAHTPDFCTVGDIVVFCYDDNTVCPKFENVRTGEKFYESFSCLARYKGVNEADVVDKTKLEIVKTSFGLNYDKDDDTMLCKVEIDNITFEQYQKLLTFINTL